MDSVQKVVRGAIFFNSVFTPRAFQDEIEAVITDIIHKFGIDQKYVQDVTDQSTIKARALWNTTSLLSRYMMSLLI